MSYSKFLEKLVLPVGDLFNKSSYKKDLDYWRKLDAFSEEELATLQTKNMEKLLKFAIEKVPFYSNISIEGDDPHKWIENFPILTKEDLRNRADSLLSTEKSKLIKYSSSGSTGMQTSVYMTKREQSNIRAILTHWWEWSGYRIGNRLVQTGITPKRSTLKKIKDCLFRTVYLSAFSHSEEQLEKICKKLQKNPRKYYLAGYASSLNVIANYAIKNSFTIKLQSVISLGDKLFSHYEKNIKKAFSSKVYDTYGCNEGFLIASQKDLTYKYIMTPHVFLEILDDDDKSVADGELGHVVVTRLDAFSMPLIRYKIGDLAIKLPKEKYPKNRMYKYPLLEKIVGRETDIVELPNGKKMVVHSFTGVFEYISEIKQFQVVQEVLGSIKIRYIKSDGFSENTLVKVTKELQKYIENSEFEILYEEVSSISSSKSGKPQIIVSELKKQSC